MRVMEMKRDLAGEGKTRLRSQPGLEILFKMGIHLSQKMLYLMLHLLHLTELKP